MEIGTIKCSGWEERRPSFFSQLNTNPKGRDSGRLNATQGCLLVSGNLCAYLQPVPPIVLTSYLEDPQCYLKMLSQRV